MDFGTQLKKAIIIIIILFGAVFLMERCESIKYEEQQTQIARDKEYQREVHAHNVREPDRAKQYYDYRAGKELERQREQRLKEGKDY